MRRVILFTMALLVFQLQVGCATPNKTIVAGMLSGAVVGAGVGYQFVHHGEHRQFETQNTIITSVLFALVTGGVLSWHYREMEREQVEISGRYARYRLCGENEMPGALVPEDPSPYSLSREQIGKFAIDLDDNTKWAFPTFRKRHLVPEKGESQVLSDRYIWEILRPGQFVTRTQNPDYFLSNPEERK